jgi:hypothetical protein
MSDYGSFGRVAVIAARNLATGEAASPALAWDDAAKLVFPEKEEMQKKSCPRTTFLALCGTGRLASVAAGSYCGPTRNMEHALAALQILDREPEHSPVSLWRSVTENSGKAYNQQMHVVLALVRSGFLQISNS